MKSIHMLGLLVVAGAFGAVAGGAVGTLSQPRDDAGNRVVLDRLDEIADDVDALREAANDARDDVADVRERLVAVELELAHRASLPTPVARSGDSDVGEGGGAAALPEGVRDVISRRTLELKDRLIAAETATAAATELQARFGKSLKIRAMPEAERWQYAADTLGLNSVQVDELKAAHAELQAGLKEAVVEETNETDGGVMTFRRVDGNKMRDAQNAFQARVDNALNDDQKKAWKDEGFSAAMGRSRGASWVSPRRIRSMDVDLHGNGGGTGTATIEIVTSETIEGGGSDD